MAVPAESRGLACCVMFVSALMIAWNVIAIVGVPQSGNQELLSETRHGQDYFIAYVLLLCCIGIAFLSSFACVVVVRTRKGYKQLAWCNAVALSCCIATLTMMSLEEEATIRAGCYLKVYKCTNSSLTSGKDTYTDKMEEPLLWTLLPLSVLGLGLLCGFVNGVRMSPIDKRKDIVGDPGFLGRCCAKLSCSCLRCCGSGPRPPRPRKGDEHGGHRGQSIDSSKLITTEKLTKWNTLNSMWTKKRYFQVEQKAPLKGGWLMRRMGKTGNAWTDMYFLIKGHFMYEFTQRKMKTKSQVVYLLYKTEVEKLDQFNGPLYGFAVHFLFHRKPKWTNQQYLDWQRESMEKAARDEPVPPLYTVHLAAKSERDRTEWMMLIKFLGKQYKAGSNTLENLVRVPGVSHQDLEMGNQLNKRKYEKWKRMQLNKPRIMDIIRGDKPADLEGDLSKVGGSTNGWERRYVLLKGHFLYYFKSRMPSTKAQGMVFLRNAKIQQTTYGGVTMVVKITSKFPRKYPTSDKDKPVFWLGFDSQAHLDGWIDVLKAHASLLHAGGSKRKEKDMRMREMKDERMYGHESSKDAFGWVEKPLHTAGAYLDDLNDPGYRDVVYAKEIKAERARIKKKKLNRADMVVELGKPEKKKAMAARAKQKRANNPALTTTIDKASLQRVDIDEEEEAETIEDLKAKELRERDYKDWKLAKELTRLRLGDKLV